MDHMTMLVFVTKFLVTVTYQLTTQPLPSIQPSPPPSSTSAATAVVAAAAAATVETAGEGT